MLSFRIEYAEALRIIEERDPDYAKDVAELVALLKRRPLDAWLPEIGDIPAQRKADYLIEQYESQTVRRAVELVRRDCAAYLRAKHPSVVVE